MGKTPFHSQLPASKSVPNSKPIYRLTGARLVSYKGSPAALVAYETPTEKISLLISSRRSAVVAGGEQVRSGGLTFHYRSGADSQVITWTNQRTKISSNTKRRNVRRFADSMCVWVFAR